MAFAVEVSPLSYFVLVILVIRNDHRSPNLPQMGEIRDHKLVDTGVFQRLARFQMMVNMLLTIGQLSLMVRHLTHKLKDIILLITMEKSSTPVEQEEASHHIQSICLSLIPNREAMF